MMRLPQSEQARERRRSRVWGPIALALALTWLVGAMVVWADSLPGGVS